MDRLVFGPLDVGGTLQLGQRHEGIGLIQVLALLRAPDLQREQIAIPAKAGGAEAARLVDAPAQRVIAVVGAGKWVLWWLPKCSGALLGQESLAIICYSSCSLAHFSNSSASLLLFSLLIHEISRGVLM